MKKYLYLGCIFGILTSGVFGKTTITITSEKADTVKFDYGDGKFKEIKLNETSEIEDIDNCEIGFTDRSFDRAVYFAPTGLSYDEFIIKNDTDYLLLVAGSFSGETAEFESERFVNGANVLCHKKINIKSKKCVNFGNIAVGKNYSRY